MCLKGLEIFKRFYIKILIIFGSVLACSSSWTCHLEGKDSNYFLSSFSSYNFPSFQAYYTFHVSKFGNDVLYETILKF